MGVFSRYFLYLFDCLVMLALIGFQILIFKGESPFNYDIDNWLAVLLEGSGNLYFTTLLGGALYWTIVDYHPVLIPHRGSAVVMEETRKLPELSTRFIRSFMKAFTLFGGEILLLFAIFSKKHRFLHDYLAGTERIKDEEFEAANDTYARS